MCVCVWGGSENTSVGGTTLMSVNIINWNLWVIFSKDDMNLEALKEAEWIWEKLLM